MSLDSQTSGRIAKGSRLYGQARRQLIRPCVFYAEYAPWALYSTAITDSLDSQVSNVPLRIQFAGVIPVPLPPRKRWQNKAPLGCNLISSSKQNTGCCPIAPRWQGNTICKGAKRPENRVTRFPAGREGGAVRHQRGEGRRRRPIQQNVYHDLSSKKQDP